MLTDRALSRNQNLWFTLPHQQSLLVFGFFSDPYSLFENFLKFFDHSSI